MPENYPLPSQQVTTNTNRNRLLALLSKKQVIIGIVIFVVVGIILVALFAARNAQLQDYNGYFGNHYSISYPGNWSKKEEDKLGETRFSLSNVNPVPFVQVKVMDAYKGQEGVGAYSNEFLDSSTQNLTNFNLLNMDMVKLLELDCTQIEYTYEDNTAGVLKSKQIDMLSGDNVFRFTYTAKEADYETYLPVFDKMLGALKVY